MLFILGICSIAMDLSPAGRYFEDQGPSAEVPGLQLRAEVPFPAHHGGFSRVRESLFRREQRPAVLETFALSSEPSSPSYSLSRRIGRKENEVRRAQLTLGLGRGDDGRR